MVFSSHLFVFYFLPLTLLLYYAVPRRGKHLLLTLLSYFFYGWANPLFVVLMFTSTVIDYICGLTISRQWSRDAWKQPVPKLDPDGPRSRAQKTALIVSICMNLGLLGVFKYFNFGIESWNATLEALGFGHLAWENFLRITLPLGISFYTFQSMSYSIDVYRGDAKAIRNFTDFSCYVAMFPQLVAGPIIRFQEVAEQLQHRTVTSEKFARGVMFFAIGMAKKILIANPCGKVADTAFDAGAVGLFDAWWGVIGYSFQIYFDFSAYSDMAIGLGLMLGFVFPKNFDSPYHSQSITEFWRRWHLSLSTWLRDYLYIPLGGNRRGEKRTYANLAMVMLLGGLWHGASWNFVIWGAIHGGMLGFERLMGKESFYGRLPRIPKILITYTIVLFTWVFFRAETLGGSVDYCASMLGLNGLGGATDGASLLAGVLYQPYYVVMMIVAAIVVWLCPQTWDFSRRVSWPKVAWTACMLWLSLAVLTTQSFNPFIYFIF
jgi:alginate O-acetyltransferase complex protein AlgI